MILALGTWVSGENFGGLLNMCPHRCRRADCGQHTPAWGTMAASKAAEGAAGQAQPGRLDGTHAQCSRPVTGTEDLPQAHAPPVVVVSPAEIGLASAPAVTETLIFALSTSPAIVVAELTGTAFCDSAAIRSLRHTTHHAAARGLHH